MTRRRYHPDSGMSDSEAAFRILNGGSNPKAGHLPR